MKKIVVLGAGYAGLMTVQKLSKMVKKDEAEIILVNKNPYHYEATWLHEVAAGTMTAERAMIDLKGLVDEEKVEIVIDEVLNVNKGKKQVELKNGILEYDYLVFALGFVTNTFGIKGVEEYTHFIQDIDTAKKVSIDVERKIQDYANSEDKNKKDLTILIGGSGFTGVELIGEILDKIPELAKRHGIQSDFIKIINIEGSSGVLKSFEEYPKLVRYTCKTFLDKGVIFKRGRIKEVSEEGFIINDERALINGDIKIWTCGVKANPVIETIGCELLKGSVHVTPELLIPQENDIFVLGDCSWIVNKKGGYYAPTAQIATQSGIHCARNIVASLRGEKMKPFKFSNKGMVASLGDYKGVGAVFGGIQVKGYLGSLLKKVVDDRTLLMLGGIKLWFEKTKFKK